MRHEDRTVTRAFPSDSAVLHGAKPESHNWTGVKNLAGKLLEQSIAALKRASLLVYAVERDLLLFFPVANQEVWFLASPVHPASLYCALSLLDLWFRLGTVFHRYAWCLICGEWIGRYSILYMRHILSRGRKTSCPAVTMSLNSHISPNF